MGCKCSKAVDYEKIIKDIAEQVSIEHTLIDMSYNLNDYKNITKILNDELGIYIRDKLYDAMITFYKNKKLSLENFDIQKIDYVGNELSRSLISSILNIPQKYTSYQEYTPHKSYANLSGRLNQSDKFCDNLSEYLTKINIDKYIDEINIHLSQIFITVIC